MLSAARCRSAVITLALLLILLPVRPAKASPANCGSFDKSGYFYASCSDSGSSGIRHATGGSVVTPTHPTVGSSSGQTRCEVSPGDAACDLDLGRWTGDCFAQPVRPQPPLSDPVWNGNTTGSIMSCNAPVALGRYYSTRRFWVPAADAAPPPPNPADVARQAIAQLSLQPPGIETTPPANILINRPTHLWVGNTGPTTLGPASASATDRGLTVTATATLREVMIRTGDGAVISCTREEVTGAPTDPTGPPRCGHTWTRTSRAQPSGAYTVTATSTWSITWTGGGQTGAETTQTTSTQSVTVIDHPVRLVPNG